MENCNIIKATLNLFNAYPINSHLNVKQISYNDCNYSCFDIENIKHGIFVSEDVKKNAKKLNEFTNIIIDICGYDINSLNNAFHKSFKTVKESSDSKLFFEQIFHYMTTYGMQSIGAFNDSSVFIPNELLSIPLEDFSLNNTKITIIKGITMPEIKNNIINMISSGIALSKNTIDNITILIKECKIKDIDIDVVTNKEIRSILYDYYNTVPKNPIEFLRFVLYKSTDSSLLIKNDFEFQMIKRLGDEQIINNLFDKYVEQYDLSNLATIFYRYKKLWLAMKNSHTASYINKMRRLAVKYHQPCKIKLLDKVASPCFDDSESGLALLQKELNKVTIYKKISILNAFSYRFSMPKSIAYKIRNGMIFSKENNNSHLPSLKVYNFIMNDVLSTLKNKLSDKVFYIPETISYAFPTSEKMFIGNIPFGTKIAIGLDAIVGVHWNNMNNKQTDLDLHCLNQKEMFGWDSACRNFAHSLLFTGDLTNAPAPKGATEAYYLSKDVKDTAYMFNLNFFNFTNFNDFVLGKNTMPFELIVDKADKNTSNSDYIIKQSSILTHIKMEMKTPAQSIGIINSDELGNKEFVFTNYSSGYNITSSNYKDKDNHLYNFLINSIHTQLSFNDLIIKAGASIIKDKNAFEISKNEYIEQQKKNNKELDDDFIIQKANNKFINLDLNNVTKDIFTNF